MNRLPPFMQVILAGVISSVITSLIFLAFDLGGVFKSLGVPMSVPADLLDWFAVRLLYGGIFALLLLLPVLTDWRLWQRGLLIGLIPAAELLLYRYPSNDLGMFGIKLGISVPIVALIFSLLWGALTGWLLPRFGFPDPSLDEDEDEEVVV